MTVSTSSRTTELAAILEVVGVLIVAIFAGRFVQAGLGVPQWKVVQSEMVVSGTPDFWELARLATIEQALKYGLALALFYVLGYWLRRRRIQSYGMRSGGRTFGQSLALGFVLWAAMGWLPNAVQLLATFYPALGSGPGHWALFPTSWSLGFLAFMAASSFLLVPVVEELYFRGYLVTRLSDGFAQSEAVLLSTLFFTLAHGQYLVLEALSLIMLASLALGSLFAGYVFVRTETLLPVIFAHALVNLPTPPSTWGRPAVLTVMSVVLLIARRDLLKWLADLMSFLRSARPGSLLRGTALMIVVLVLVSRGAWWVPGLALCLILVSVALQYRTSPGPTDPHR